MVGIRVSQQPTVDDAVSYLLDVKEEFHDEPAKYGEFLKLMNDVHVDRVDTVSGIARMTEIIKGHPKLLLGSEVFFPEEAIVIPPKAEKGFETVFGRRVQLEPTMDDAFSYLDSVKKALHDEPATYDEFTKLLHDVSAHRIDKESGITRMAELIKGHPKLLLGLRAFLPGAKITIPPEDKKTIPPKAKITILLPKASRTSPLKVKRTIPHKASRTIPPKAEQPTNSDELNFMDKLKTRFRSIDTHVVGSFCSIMKMFEERKKSIKEVHEEVVDLLYYHEDLIEDFSRIFPKHS